MSVALDCGTCWFRSLRTDDPRLLSRCARAVFATLPDTAAQRELLERAGVSFAVGDDYLALIGDAAENLSPVFRTACRDLLPYGDLPADDPVVRQAIAILVESLIPEAGTAGELCCLIRCGGSESNPGRLSRRTEFFSRLVRLRGYRPIELSAGTAVVLAGLADQGFTGIGLDFGASGCDVAVARCGVPVATCWIPRGGRWIDEQLARRQQWFQRQANGVLKPDVARAATAKLSFQGTLTKPANAGETLLATLYREVLTPVVEQVGGLLKNCGDATLRGCPPLTIACSGGAAKPPGFVQFAFDLFHEAVLTVPAGAVRLADDADHAVLRGGLIHAEVERASPRSARPAA
jgi:hypothetical protein